LEKLLLLIGKRFQIAVIEKEIEDTLGGVAPFDAKLDVDPANFKRHFSRLVCLRAPENKSLRVRWRLTGAGVIILEFLACGSSSGLPRLDETW
jgi:hypothetical protein